MTKKTTGAPSDGPASTPAISPAEAAGRALVARTTFEKEAVWLPLLAVQHWNAGQMAIAGKTFTDCVIEGPAIMAVMTGTRFDDCAMGTTSDMRSLLYRPVSETRMGGVVGMTDCVFTRCRFVQVGFTGGEALIEELSGVTSRPRGAGTTAP